jgi:hypothetical protein
MVLGSQGPGRVGRRRFSQRKRDARAAHPGRRGSRLLTRGPAASARGTRTPVRAVPPRRGAGAARRAMHGGGDARLPAPYRVGPRLRPPRAAARSRGRRRRARGRTARSGGVGGRRGTCVRRLGTGSDGTFRGRFAAIAETRKPCKSAVSRRRVLQWILHPGRRRVRRNRGPERARPLAPAALRSRTRGARRSPRPGPRRPGAGRRGPRPRRSSAA